MDPGATLGAAADRARAGILDLESELAGIAASTALVPDDEHDAEGSTIGLERARVTALLVLARHHLAEIQAANDRVQRGDAGRCATCGATIPAERLAALPTARLCIGCAAPQSSGMLGRVR